MTESKPATFANDGYPALAWKQFPGAWCAGPFMVAERVTGGWNATALFENADETSNTSMTIDLNCPSMVAAMDACQQAYENILASFRKMA